MSATNRIRQEGPRTVRVDEDAYLTPPLLAFTCASLLDLRAGQSILEPSAGEGSFVAGIHRAHGLVAHAVEKRRAVADSLRKCLGEAGPEVPVRILRFEDVLEPGAWDAVVGNPPYRRAQAHVEHAHYLLRDGGLCAFLLRINFVATQERYRFFKRLAPWRIYTLAERPDFTGGGGDATEYGFFVWRKGWVGDTVVRWVSWKDDLQRADDVSEIRRLDWAAAA